jgi:hypothetical protein
MGQEIGKTDEALQSVEVLVKPWSKPASITRFFRIGYDADHRFPTA